MRKPRFNRWIKKKLLEEANLKTFNLNKLAALAQNEHPRLAEPLLLWAISTDNVNRLLPLIWRDGLKDKYQRVIGIFEGKDIEQEALKGEILPLLPNLYARTLNEFYDAYNGSPEEAKARQDCWDEIHWLQLEMGIRNSEIYQDLNLNHGNTNRYLKYGELDKLSLEKAQLILQYLKKKRQQVR